MEKKIQNKLEKSQKTFLEWKKTSFSERKKLLSQLSKILMKRKQEFAEIITKEMNKPISQSVSEIEKCAGMIGFYALF